NLLTIQETQEQLIALRDTQSTFDREMALCKPLIAMELDGIAINQPKVAELKAETEILIHKWQLFLDTLLGEELAINVASPAQLADLLYTKLKLPKRVRASKITTDEDALASLLTINPLVVKPIMLLKKLKKEVSEYKTKLSADGRFRACFKPAGTMTGRLASSKSILGSGSNLQNKTKKIRVYFEPDNTETQLFINVDYAKAESWAVAALAEDHKMLDALYGEDFHSTNASNILGKLVTKENYSDRQLGKRITHGASYRMTPFLLQKVLLKDGYTFSKTEANDLMEQFHNNYPNIRGVFHRRIEEQLKMDRTLTNVYGRKITFWEHYGNPLLNSATAFLPQSTIAEMTNTALVRIYNTILEVKLKIQVHDSLLLQVHKKDITTSLIERIEKCMLQPLEINGIKFTVPTDYELGSNWRDLSDISEWSELIAENNNRQISNLPHMA
ncbi:MAG: DNA polymerase, partial [Prolixibacteraceae bacterium]|nr:DNA polymerase [Prolixibacteraceae bacterium]